MEEAIKRTIEAVSHRLRVRRLYLWVGTSGLVGGIAALLFLLLLKAGGGSYELSRCSLVLWGVGIAVGFVLGARKALPPYAVAKLTDDALDLKDRLSSACSFLAQGQSGGFVDLAVQDAAAIAESVRAADVVPRPAWGRVAVGLCILPILISVAQRRLFPPPPERKAEVFSEAELGAALSAIDMAMEDPQTFQQLQEELKKLGIGETTEKSELLARLNRTISELKQQAESDEGILATLEQMEKLKAKLGLAELQMRADEELRQVEQLVTDTGVAAETILVDPLVDAARAQEVAKSLKEVAEKQLASRKGGDTAQGVEEQPTPAGEKAGKGEDQKPKTGEEGAGLSQPDSTEAAGDLALRAISDEAIRKRILKVAREADRGSADYASVYRNYRRAFLAEIFRMDLGSGRKEYLERYFYTIRPEKK
jgi:hypothetical protein